VRCDFFKLEPVENGDANCLLISNDLNFSLKGLYIMISWLKWAEISTNIMPGKRNSVLAARLKVKLFLFTVIVIWLH